MRYIMEKEHSIKAKHFTEVLKKNRNWIVVYLAIGLFNAFTSNYKADCFQRIVDGLTDQTITLYGILFYGAVLFVTYIMNYISYHK